MAFGRKVVPSDRQADAQGAAGQAENGGLEEELAADERRLGAQGLAQADLA